MKLKVKTKKSTDFLKSRYLAKYARLAYENLPYPARYRTLKFLSIFLQVLYNRPKSTFRKNNSVYIQFMVFPIQKRGLFCHWMKKDG